MTSDYAIVTVGELASSISDTHRLGKERLIFLNTSDILHGKILHHNYSLVKDWPGQAKKSIRKDDILFSEIRPANGRWAYVGHDSDDYVVSTKLMVIRVDRKRLLPKFFYHFLTSAEVTGWLQHLAESRSGTFPQITFAEVANLEMPLPPLGEQELIASIIDRLEDKIELNRRMASVLEEMARALFRSWFVDFDPVRSKLDRCHPVGMDEATAALFPDQLENCSLGHIPKGWSVGTVAEGFNLIMGQSPSGDTYNEEGNGLPFYQGSTDFGFRFPARRVYCSSPTRYAKPGDTLVSVRAPVGSINMANESCCIGRGVAAVRHKSLARSFTYYSMATLSPDFARFEAEGTVFGSINKKNFESLLVLIPPSHVIAAYEGLAEPLDERICALERQSRTLSVLRDVLLPKLLSGELTVAHLQDNEELMNA